MLVPSTVNLQLIVLSVKLEYLFKEQTEMVSAPQNMEIGYHKKSPL